MSEERFFRGEYLPADSINSDIFARQCGQPSKNSGKGKRRSLRWQGEKEDEGGVGEKERGFTPRYTAVEKLEEAERAQERREDKGERVREKEGTGC